MKDFYLVCAELIQTEEKEANTTGEPPRIDILVTNQAISKPSGPQKGRSKNFPAPFICFCFQAVCSANRPRHKRRPGHLNVPPLLLRMRFTTRVLPLLLSSPLPFTHTSSPCLFSPRRDTDLCLRSPIKKEKENPNLQLHRLRARKWPISPRPLHGAPRRPGTRLG